MSSDVLEELRTLTVADLVRATGIAEWRIYSMLKEGTGPPFIRIGSTYRFPILGVRRWLAEQVSNAKDG